MVVIGALARTVVRGVELLVNSYERAHGSQVHVTLNTDAIAFSDEARAFAEMGLLPEGMYRNRQFAQAHVNEGDVVLAKQDLLYDPQTSGGLLIAVHPDDAEALWEDLQATVPCAQRIGTVEDYTSGVYITLRL